MQVGTQVSGRIQKLYADFNSQVKKGELVAKIDPQLFEAAVAAGAGQLPPGEGRRRDRRRRSAHERRQAVRAHQGAQGRRTSPRRQDLDTAEANVATTHAGDRRAPRRSLAQAARAARHQAQVNLSYTSIISPIDGVVISRSVDVGQTVAASLSAPTLFTIAQDLTKMQVDTNVSEGDVGRLQVGMTTYFTVDSFPGQRFVGTIRQIRNAATTVQNVVTYDAVIDVDNADLRLRPGMTANVTVVYAERRDVARRVRTRRCASALRVARGERRRRTGGCRASHAHVTGRISSDGRMPPESADELGPRVRRRSQDGLGPARRATPQRSTSTPG